MKLVKNRPFTRQVTVKLPSGDGEDFVDQTFTGRFQALSTDEAEGFVLHTRAGREALLDRVLIGWDGVLEEVDGKDVPMAVTPEAKAMLIQDPFVQSALIQTYVATLSGASRKN